MEIPLQIATRNITLAPADEDAIRLEAQKLETYADRITSCRVMVERPHRRGREGQQFLVRIDLTLPGQELVVKRQPQGDLRSALQDAFDVARRQVRDFMRRRRDRKPVAKAPDQATVRVLFPWEGYGFLVDHRGRDIYFHENSVLNSGFAQLNEGMPVRFVEVEGEKGPQASTVIPLRKART